MRRTRHPGNAQLALVLAIAVAVATAVPSAAAPKPVRSGTILSGAAWLGYYVGNCQSAPDCAAWLQSGCNPALSGRDPGVMASIVSVTGLADGRTWRTFWRNPGKPVGLAWGRSVIQLWTSDCTEILASRTETTSYSTNCGPSAAGRECSWAKVRIPKAARWMTVTGDPENVHLTWTLT